MKRVRLSLVAVATIMCTVAGTLSGCGKKPAGEQNAASATVSGGPQTPDIARVATATAAVATKPSPKPVDPMVVLHTTQGDITVQLFPEKAPRTVENFLRGYAERGFYDQTIFHHVEPGLMLIAGGYTAELERKPARAPIYNESRNGLSNRRGTLAMIRDPATPHSATSEFFVNLADNPDFDFKPGDGAKPAGEENEVQPADDNVVSGYCVFGEVISGMDVVDRIAQLPTASQGDFTKVPSPPVAITAIKRLQ